MENSWAWLIITGGALEVAGILLVAWDLRRTGKEVRRYQEPRDQVVHPGTIDMRMKVFPPTVTGGREPTVPERVGFLERALATLRREVENYSEAIERSIDERTGEATKRVEQAAISRDEAIANLLLAVTAQGRWLRISSIVLLLLGVAAATLGGILSNL